jgi:hypothetical protein
MKNIELAINILMDLFSMGAEIAGLIKKANATGEDISNDDLNDIISQRNQILDELKAIGGVN